MIEALFNELEQEEIVDAQGLLERRLPTQSHADLFVGVFKPANTRMFRASFAIAHLVPLDNASFRGLDIQLSESNDPNHVRADIRLTVANTSFNDLFSALVEDIALHIATVSDEGAAANAMIARLVRWQRFLEHHSPDGLTPEQQRGLFGELYFLRQHLLTFVDTLHAVRAWTGPETLAKDFELAATGIEVKTTISKLHQNLQISSERQLDDEGLDSLFVYHLSLEPIHGAGETLPQAILQLRDALSADGTASARFEDKLQAAGYFDTQVERYQTVGYIVRESNLFHVHGDFPRITEADLRVGVGDVRYSIGVGVCKQYSASIASLAEVLEGPPA